MSVINTPAKSDVVTSIRALQLQNGVRVYAETTLARMKAADLSDLEATLLAQLRSAAEEAQVDAKTESSDRHTGGRRLFSNDAIIRVIGTVSGRDGSAALARRQLLGDGLSVAEFIASVEAETGSTVGARRTIRKAIRKGLIRLEKALYPVGDCLSSEEVSELIASEAYIGSEAHAAEISWALPSTPAMMEIAA